MINQLMDNVKNSTSKQPSDIYQKVFNPIIISLNRDVYSELKDIITFIAPAPLFKYHNQVYELSFVKLPYLHVGPHYSPNNPHLTNSQYNDMADSIIWFYKKLVQDKYEEVLGCSLMPYTLVDGMRILIEPQSFEPMIGVFGRYALTKYEYL